MCCVLCVHYVEIVKKIDSSPPLYNGGDESCE